MADAADSKSAVAIRVGSSPISCITIGTLRGVLNVLRHCRKGKTWNS